jgi:hypothetical protein
MVGQSPRGPGTQSQPSEGTGAQTVGIQVLRSIAQQIDKLAAAVLSVFPQQTGTSATATGGSATLPAQPVGFIVVTLPSGATAKIPYYSS